MAKSSSNELLQHVVLAVKRLKMPQGALLRDVDEYIDYDLHQRELRRVLERAVEKGKLRKRGSRYMVEVPATRTRRTPAPKRRSASSRSRTAGGRQSRQTRAVKGKQTRAKSATVKRKQTRAKSATVKRKQTRAKSATVKRKQTRAKSATVKRKTSARSRGGRSKTTLAKRKRSSHTSTSGSSSGETQRKRRKSSSSPSSGSGSDEEFKSNPRLISTRDSLELLRERFFEKQNGVECFQQQVSESDASPGTSRSDASQQANLPIDQPWWIATQASPKNYFHKNDGFKRPNNVAKGTSTSDLPQQASLMERSPKHDEDSKRPDNVPDQSSDGEGSQRSNRPDTP